jgi:hypothetical protein
MRSAGTTPHSSKSQSHRTNERTNERRINDRSIVLSFLSFAFVNKSFGFVESTRLVLPTTTIFIAAIEANDGRFIALAGDQTTRMFDFCMCVVICHISRCSEVVVRARRHQTDDDDGTIESSRRRQLGRHRNDDDDDDAQRAGRCDVARDVSEYAGDRGPCKRRRIGMCERDGTYYANEVFWHGD